MHSTTVLFRALACSLNLRTEVAQVGVSTLGKMFRILRLPAKVARGRIGQIASSRGEGPSLLTGNGEVAGDGRQGCLQG